MASKSREFASHFRSEDTGNLMLRVIDPLVRRQLGAVATRREPALAAGDEQEDWKEF
ncbi:MAG: hypothetical protein M3R58_16305 [Pseudomonadota bacterium]|nr:hypothetical protein [Pseudomonadota bacterium]